MTVSYTMLMWLGGDYDFIAYINTQTNEETIFNFDPVFSKFIPEWNTIAGFEEGCKIISDLIFVPEDRADFLKAMKIDIILKELETKKIYLINFPETINGKIIYYIGKFVLAEIHGIKHIIAGFWNADEEIRAERE